MPVVVTPVTERAEPCGDGHAARAGRDSFDGYVTRYLNQWLEAGLDARPDDVAVETIGRSVSFRDLEELSNGLAAQLQREHHIGAGDRVAFLAEKAIELVIGVAAVWKRGAIYAPLDAGSPPMRLDGMLRKLAPSLLISSEARLSSVADRWPEIPRLSYERMRELGMRLTDVPRVNVDGDSPAIIMHTSGSTGTPKGVVLSHHSVTSYFASHNRLVAHDIRSRSMNTGPFHFDVSLQDTMLPIFYGGTVFFHNDVYVSSVMLELLRSHRITHLTAICSVLDLISKNRARIATLRDGPLRVLTTGGEVCSPKLIDQWLEAIPHLRAYYGYGPTECNSLCTAHQVAAPSGGRTTPYPIGRPFDGMTAVLLDEAEAVLTEAEATGVLAMAGPQLLTEYWRDPEETARAIRIIDGTRFYVTGDVCRRDADGCFHFVGRRDTEVKIRGRRINLNEVRNALLNHERVRFAIVRTWPTNGDTSIVALAHVDRRDEDLARDLDGVLSERLPAYMMPRLVCLTTELPQTSTAKVDEATAMEVVSPVVAANPVHRYVWVDAKNRASGEAGGGVRV
jgi:amino acid adenylation domain-containing protein